MARAARAARVERVVDGPMGPMILPKIAVWVDFGGWDFAVFSSLYIPYRPCLGSHAGVMWDIGMFRAVRRDNVSDASSP